jgi:SAM-dependent methyltransferase
MLHVLEHLHDPLGALVKIRDWLVPGGRLYIEVPNVYQPYGSLEGNFFVVRDSRRRSSSIRLVFSASR